MSTQDDAFRAAHYAASASITAIGTCSANARPMSYRDPYQAVSTAKCRRHQVSAFNAWIRAAEAAESAGLDDAAAAAREAAEVALCYIPNTWQDAARAARDAYAAFVARGCRAMPGSFYP